MLTSDTLSLPLTQEARHTKHSAHSILDMYCLSPTTVPSKVCRWVVLICKPPKEVLQWRFAMTLDVADLML